MKRVITAIILTVLTLALAFTGKKIATDSILFIQETMTQIDTDLEKGNYAQALETSQTFLEEWDKHHGRMCIFLQHDHLDPLENIFALLPYYIEHNEIVIARANCRTVCTVTEHILKTEQITVENLL